MTDITNDGATLTPSNYEIDDRTGWRLLPGEAVRDGQIQGMYVSKKVRDDRHPQERLRSYGGDRLRGPKSPEPDDIFISGDIDPAIDL